jgi:DNA-binding CsgD family transcriptional regulator
VAGILNTDSTDFGAFAVQRSARQGHVAEAEIQLMSVILPHVSQALEVTRRIRQANSVSSSLGQALDWLTDGVLLLDGDGTVVYVNSAFEKMSKAHDGLSLRRGVLTFSSADARDRLRNALALLRDLGDGRPTGRGSDFTVTRPSGLPSYLISVRPLPPAEKSGTLVPAATTMVFVRDPTTTNAAASESSKTVLGLTDAEAALASALCGGISPSQYAATHRLSLNTVYTHLSRIKQKANCRRMAELIRRLNDLQVPARIEP